MPNDNPVVKKDSRILESKDLNTATLIIPKAVIPAKAGIQKNTRFRVKPGMTNRIRLISSCISVKRSNI